MPLVTKNFADIITFTRASTATYFDSAGVLQSAAVDQPRFDYNPSTLAAQGFLIEEQRSNIVYPSNFSSIGTVAVNNAWYEVDATLDTTVNAGVAPDGTTTAALLAINAPTTFNAAQYRTTSTTAATYAFSCFCKANSTDTLVRLQVSGETGFVNLVRADFTLTGVGTAGAASAVGTATAPSAPAIQPVGNGWYRCTIIAALTAPTNITCAIYPGTTGAQTTASQTLVWGAQLEAGAFPTSYIPTTTTALTRSADVASVNTLSPWYNATASTLYTEFISPVPTTVTASAVVAGYDDGTANNRFSNFYTSATPATLAANQTTGGTPNFSISAASGLTLSNVQKQATRFQAGSYASSANGAAAVTDPFASALPTVNTLRFGLRPSGTQANMWLRRVTVYPRGLSNAELQAITA